MFVRSRAVRGRLRLNSSPPPPPPSGFGPFCRALDQPARGAEWFWEGYGGSEVGGVGLGLRRRSDRKTKLALPSAASALAVPFQGTTCACPDSADVVARTQAIRQVPRLRDSFSSTAKADEGGQKADACEVREQDGLFETASAGQAKPYSVEIKFDRIRPAVPANISPDWFGATLANKCLHHQNSHGIPSGKGHWPTWRTYVLPISLFRRLPIGR